MGLRTRNYIGKHYNHTIFIMIEHNIFISAGFRPTRFYFQEGFKYTFNAKACHGDDDKVVEYLEHIVLKSHILCPYRGAISIYIKSPSGNSKIFLFDPVR